MASFVKGEKLLILGFARIPPATFPAMMALMFISVGFKHSVFFWSQGDMKICYPFYPSISQYFRLSENFKISSSLDFIRFYPQDENLKKKIKNTELRQMKWWGILPPIFLN